MTCSAANRRLAIAFGLAGLFAAGASSAAAPARPPITGVSHIAVYSSDAAKTDAFYTHTLGATKGADAENPAGVRYYFSPAQYVEVLPLKAEGKNRLDHIAFTTADAAALRTYLLAKKVTVPALTKGADGSLSFIVTDPEGNRVEFVQPGKLADVPVNPLSGHIIHVGMIVHDRALEDSFYRDILGLRPYWWGGFKPETPNWVSQQVPDGSDWLEYMLAGTPADRGMPADMSQKTAGVLNHFSLGVSNIEAVYTQLWNGKRIDGQTEVPKIGLDAKWQLNFYDPDGTRAEIMELHAIGTPCCSPFTASDPEK